MAGLAVVVAGLAYCGGVGAESRATQNVTAVTVNNCRLRLWYGSLRLNRDEWPLIVRDRYSFQCGAQAVEPRFGLWYGGLETGAGTNWLEIRSEDPAGTLVRRVTFGADSVDLRFNLQVKPEYRKNPDVRYLVQFSPDYFYGRADTNGVRLSVTRATGHVEQISLPPFLNIRENRNWRKFIAGWRTVEMCWSGLAGPQKMSIEIAEGMPGTFVDDRVSQFVYYISVPPVLVPLTNDAVEARCVVRIIFPLVGQ